MICCLNPDCQNLQNPDSFKFCQSCGTKLEPLRNRYRIIRLLGAGGFGRTFLAEDIDKLNEQCVVKQFLPQAQGSWAIQKATDLFQKEAKRLQQLGEHSQIPTLYAYFEEEKRLYLVQQFIEGENLLQELAKQGSFDEGKIKELLLDLLPIIKFIHQHHVIHRDIKPDNIIRRSSDNKLVLIDFGIAKQLTETALIHPGTHIGTLGYAPLEQMQGGEASPVSDLYSLGVTCFHLLTRTHPHVLFINNGYEWVKNWRQYLPITISDQLSYVLEKLLQKNREQRYQSVDEFFQDLNSSISLPPVVKASSLTQLTPVSQTYIPPVSTLPPTPPIEPVNIFKKRRVIGWLGGITLLVSLAGYWYWQKSSFPKNLTHHSGAVNTVVISQDGKTLASGSDDQTIKLWNLNFAREIGTLKGHSDWVYSIALSSSNNQIVVSGSKDKTIKVWDVKTGKTIVTLKAHKGLVNAVALNRDNQTIASASYDNTIKLWNLKTKQLIRTLTGHSSAVLSVVFSPNEPRLISGSADKTIKVWNLKTGRLLRTLTGHLGDVNSITLSPDGQLLASGSEDRTIKVWNPNTGRELRTLTGHLADINAVAFSPDGRILASGSDDKTIKLWNLITGEEIGTLRGHLGPIYALAFSPDGKLLVSGSEDKTIKIWQVPK